MRVLWLSITASRYSKNTSGHNGGGWVASLERVVTENTDLELGITFVSDLPDEFKVERNGVTYYPLYLNRSRLQSVKDRFTYEDIDNATISMCMDVVRDFKPDVIQVFGSEWCFGLIKEHTDIPIVIHMQGSWPAYRNALLPLGYNRIGEYLQRISKPRDLVSYKLREMISEKRMLREEHILRINNHYMGRTRWDKALVQLYAPHAHYHYCNEALRDDFVADQSKWLPKDREKKIFITVGSSSRLKGLEYALKTSKLIKENSTMDFEWQLLGPSPQDMNKYEKRVGYTCCEVNVVPLGRCEADQVKEKLLNADVYVHTAYIDNSPNAVCEAQYLGLPIIATNVGGVYSLFAEDYNQDMLVPTNDPYYLAAKILELVSSQEMMIGLSDSNYKIARHRHSDERIAKQLLATYENMLSNK